MMKLRFNLTLLLFCACIPAQAQVGTPRYWFQNRAEVAGPWCTFDVKGEVTQEARYDTSPGYGTSPTTPPLQKNIAGLGTAGGTYRVQADTRSVKLSRNGQDRSELKDGSWVTYGDTLYSWVKQFSNGDSSPARNPQSFHTEYNGNWSSDYALPGVYWNWVPDGSFETRAATPGDPSSTSFDKYNSSWIMATGTAYEEPPLLGVGQTAWSDKTDPAKEITLKYFARDTDGAQAQATYKLTLHNPVEKVGLDDTIKWAESAFLQSDGTYLLHTGEPCAIGEKKVAIGSTSTKGFFLSSSLSGFLPFLKLLGISASYSSSHSSSVTETLELKTALTINQYVFAIARDNYIRHHSKFYAFDVNGRVRRIVTKKGDGTPLPAPLECYHEACVDDYQNTQCRWSDPVDRLNGDAPAAFTAANNTIKDPSFDYS